MTEKEFTKRDRELQEKYNEYLSDCAEHEIQVGINHREMARIQINRADLLHEYEDSMRGITA